MATEHTLTLKAVLDDNDIKQKLAGMESGSSDGGASAVDKLANSLKHLNQAIGGAAIARSFLNLAKSAELFGEGSDKVAAQVQGSMNNLFAAMATGNIAVVAFTAAIEALNFAVASAKEEADEDARRTQSLNQAYRSTMGSVRRMGERDRSKELESIISSGDIGRMQSEISRLSAERAKSEMAFQRRRAAPVSEHNASVLESNVNRVFMLDKEIQQLQTALDKATEAEKKRAEAQGNAKESPENDGFPVDKTPPPTAQNWANMLGLVAGQSMSGFGSSGMSMGEGEQSLEQIVDKVDTIIRLMEDIIRGDLMVKNQGNMTL